MSRVPLKRGSWKIIHRTSWACSTQHISLVAICLYLKVLYLGIKVPFRLFLGFHWRDFPQYSYLALSTHALQTIQVSLRSVTNNCVNKVKCTVVQALRLCTGRTAHRGSRGIALLFHDHGTRRGWGVSFTPCRSLPSEDPVPIVQEAGWAPGPVWTGAENPAPTGIRSPDRPARS